jgi:N-methylhydantoinase B
MTVMLDPVTLAVIQNSLRHICNEMDLAHERSSFSPVISEARDRANGIYHRDTGEVVAQGDTGLLSFVGVMQFTTQAIIRHRQDFEPGDVFVVNDPYFGGTHLMDVKMCLPFFYRDRLWCFLSNSGHWPDLGGMVPGGFAVRATEIQQEGLRLPPVKLIRRGELCQDIVDLILSNIRVPEERLWDIKAQVGALKVGARELTRFLDRYGADTVDEAVAELKRRSERQMRSHIATIPDGTYSFSSDLDSDGVENTPLTVHLDMTVRGSDIDFDYSKSSPPCKGPMNSVWAITQSATYIALKHVFPDVPVNSGCFEPVHIAKPLGTFLYAEYPRPVSGCAAEVSQRIIEVIFGAMAQALPGRIAAASFNSAGNFTLGGYDPGRKRSYVLLNFSGGGYGASADADGLSTGSSLLSVSKTQPVEILERRFPVLFEEYALRADSGGAGRRRGGLGVVYRVRLLRGDGTASFLMEHGRTGPHGLYGGQAGGKNEIRVLRDGRIDTLEHVSKGDGIVLAPGERVEVRTPGGGGYGPPGKRERARVELDVRRGYITAGHARSVYGFDAGDGSVTSKEGGGGSRARPRPVPPAGGREGHARGAGRLGSRRGGGARDGRRRTSGKRTVSRARRRSS